MPSVLPLLLEPEQLERHLGEADLLIVDLSREEHYLDNHIPGAIFVSPAEIMSGLRPAVGKLISQERLRQLVNRLGLTPQSRVVVCDDEGGGWAGRFIWTLDVIGHRRWSYLNGGMVAWRNEGFPVTDEIPDIAATDNQVSLDLSPVAEVEEILSNLSNEDFVVWDARSEEEYDGVRSLAARAGHIPGAIRCEWTSLMDADRNLRIRQDADSYLASLGFTSDKIIATHCHSHHRSGFTYLVARLLGYPQIKAYHGSWSEWGNLPDTPIER